LHGSASFTFGQFSAFDRIRAIEVFPTPRLPVKRNALAIRPSRMALRSVVATESCPTTSPNVLGRYLSAKGW
jgi:hypothetical protein